METGRHVAMMNAPALSILSGGWTEPTNQPQPAIPAALAQPCWLLIPQVLLGILRFVCSWIHIGKCIMAWVAETPGHGFSNHHPNQRHFQVGTNTTLKNTSQGVLVLEGLASGSWSPWNTLGVKSSYSWTQWQQNWNVCDSLIPLWMPGGWLRWHFVKP